MLYTMGQTSIQRLGHDREAEMLHPYVAGVLIGGITFLLAFRVTQSYGRYCKLSR